MTETEHTTGTLKPIMYQSGGDFTHPYPTQLEKAKKSITIMKRDIPAMDLFR
jgi:hypothetical protein